MNSSGTQAAPALLAVTRSLCFGLVSRSSLSGCRCDGLESDHRICLKNPIATGQFMRRGSSQPPSSSHLSLNGDGSFGQYVKLAGGDMRKETLDSTHDTPDPGHA